MPQVIPFSNLFTTIYKKKWVISSAQLLTLSSAPITLLNAPGASKYIQISSVQYSLVYGTTTYVCSDTGCGIYYLNESGTAIENTELNTLLTSTSSQIWAVNNNLALTAATSLVNQPIVLISSSNPTTGNGVLTINLEYTINHA